MRSIRARFWIEIVAAVASGSLAVLTVFWHDWIEVTGWDPDGHNGAVEWLIVAVLAAVAVIAAVLARVEWRRPIPAT
jgi:hypothetical protein